MKNNKFIVSMAVIVCMMMAPACKKTFLDENLTTARSLDFYKTDAGIQSLVNGHIPACVQCTIQWRVCLCQHGLWG
jgi:hypothetical protein